MKRVKTDSRASLGEKTLTSIVRINMEGPSLQDYDPTLAMQLWASSTGTARRPQQSKRKKYMKRKSVKKPKVLVDEDTTSEEEEEVEQRNDEEAMEEGSDVEGTDSVKQNNILMRELAELE